MGRIIDISVKLDKDVPVWPGSTGFCLQRVRKLEAGDVSNNSHLEMDVHVGTHIDAPWHFLPDGATIETLDLSLLVGPAVVGHLLDVTCVTPDDLEALDVPANTQRLLLRTQNSALWEAGVSEFRKDFVALTPEAAQWVVDHGIRLVGVDYLSVQRFGDSSLTHEVLLRAGVIIVEGLDLSNVQTGTYELYCLPLKLVGAEGAPARAILVRHQATEALGDF